MKLLLIFLVLSVLSAVLSKSVTNFAKFTKCTVSSSQKSTNGKITCTVKPVSRGVSLLSGTCELNRSLVKYYANTTVWYKNVGGNFRQLLDVRKSETCGVFENLSNFPVFSQTVSWLNLTFSGLVHKCPYTSFSFVNASLKIEEEANIAKWNFWPNGIYKLRMAAYDDLDDKIVDLIIFYEMHYSGRTREF